LKTTPAKVDGAKNAQNKQIDPTISTGNYDNAAYYAVKLELSFFW